MTVMICTRVSHPEVTIDVLAGVWAGTFINISVEALVIDVSDGVGSDVSGGVSINGFPGEVVNIGIDKLIGVALIVVVSFAMIDLYFIVSVLYDIDVLVDVCLDALTAV